MKRLNYHHLYYFWRVAVNGKLTDVADELHISQSALSAQIKQLEQQIDAPLFTRSGRRLVLTEIGQKVLGYAQGIFNKGKELEQFLSKGSESTDTHLSIGVLTNLSRNFVEAFITPLFNKAGVSFSLQTRGLPNLLKGLINHEFDIVLTNCTVTEHSQQANWQQQLVARQPLAIVGPAFGAPSTSFPEGYDEVKWVLPGENSAIRSAFQFHCAKWGYQPSIKAEVDDMAMLRLLARDSNALAVLPPVVVKDEVAQGSLAVYQYIPDAHEDFYAISVNKTAFPAALSELLDNKFSADSDMPSFN